MLSLVGKGPLCNAYRNWKCGTTHWARNISTAHTVLRLTEQNMQWQGLLFIISLKMYLFIQWNLHWLCFAAKFWFRSWGYSEEGGISLPHRSSQWSGVETGHKTVGSPKCCKKQLIDTLGPQTTMEKVECVAYWEFLLDDQAWSVAQGAKREENNHSGNYNRFQLSLVNHGPKILNEKF